MIDMPKFTLPSWDYVGHIGLTSAAFQFLLDADGEYAAQIIEIPKTGVVVGGEFELGITAFSGGTLAVRLETVNTVNAIPSGTLYHANADGTAILALGDAGVYANDGYGGGTSWGEIPVTKGDLVAFVLRLSGAGQVRVNRIDSNNFYDQQIEFPYFSAINISLQGGMIGALEYQGGVYEKIIGLFPYDELGIVTYNNGSATKEYGAKIVLPHGVRTTGIRLALDIAGNTVISLYDSAGNELTSTRTLLSANRVNITTALGTGSVFAQWLSPQVLKPNTAYYVGVKPQTGTNIALAFIGVPTTAHKKMLPGEGIVSLVERSTQGSGVWTETPLREPRVSLLCDGIMPSRRANYLMGV